MGKSTLKEVVKQRFMVSLIHSSIGILTYITMKPRSLPAAGWNAPDQNS